MSTHDDMAAWFLWDEPQRPTMRELRDRLSAANHDEKVRLLGKILREAPDPLVWEVTTVAEVRELFPELARYLGRRRAFWEFLLDAWKAHGLA